LAVRSIAAATVVVAAALLPGCPFQSFDVAPANGVPAGGSAGASGGGGGSPLGGAASAQGGAPLKPAPPHAIDDEYFMRQGEKLELRDGGVLANDAPNEIEVIDYDDVLATRKDDYEPIRAEIDRRGTLVFEPHVDFFGPYQLTYTVRNRDGLAASAVVTIHVAPTNVNLDVLIAGVGGLVLDGDERGDRLGSAVAAAGDINQDGPRDLLIGAPGAAFGSGAVYVVFGGLNLGSLGLSAALTDESYAAFVGEGDDGLGATIAAQPGAAGSVLLLLGASGGLGRVYRVPAELAARGKNQPIDAQLGAALVGDERLSGVGRLLADAGDVDGDGLTDILVAGTDGDRGVLRVVYGAQPPLSTLALADAPGLELAATGSDDGFPVAFASAGDQNGDGRAEVLTASSSNLLLLDGGSEYPGSETDVSFDGSVHGWRALRAAPGTDAAVAAVGDPDADSVQDIAYCEGAVGCRVVKTPPSTLTNGWRVTGFKADAARLMVAPAGDVDADGVPDVLFAEDSRAYLVYGRPAGRDDIDLGLLGKAGFRLSMPAGRILTALAGVGDVNADGIDDIAIGDAGARSGTGRTYLVFGVASR
jgi:hypothetical protein